MKSWNIRVKGYQGHTGPSIRLHGDDNLLCISDRFPDGQFNFGNVRLIRFFA